jgi:peptidoglycan hydrolase-like protein with peptidoglycan-binding domain
MKSNKRLLGPALLLTGCCIVAGSAWGQADKPSDRVQEGAKPGTPSNPGTPNTDQTKKAQQALKDKGLYSGPVDGVMNKTTQDAIRALQKSKNLNVTGNLDDNTARELGLEK